MTNKKEKSIYVHKNSYGIEQLHNSSILSHKEYSEIFVILVQIRQY